MTSFKHDHKPIYDHTHGRWLCTDTATALECAEQHPGDPVYTYQRDNRGKMINIKKYWAPNDPDTNRITKIRNGRIHRN